MSSTAPLVLARDAVVVPVHQNTGAILQEKSGFLAECHLRAACSSVAPESRAPRFQTPRNGGGRGPAMTRHAGSDTGTHCQRTAHGLCPFACNPIRYGSVDNPSILRDALRRDRRVAVAPLPERTAMVLVPVACVPPDACEADGKHGKHISCQRSASFSVVLFYLGEQLPCRIGDAEDRDRDDQCMAEKPVPVLPGNEMASPLPRDWAAVVSKPGPRLGNGRSSACRW